MAEGPHRQRFLPVHPVEDIIVKHGKCRTQDNWARNGCGRIWSDSPVPDPRRGPVGGGFVA